MAAVITPHARRRATSIFGTSPVTEIHASPYLVDDALQMQPQLSRVPLWRIRPEKPERKSPWSPALFDAPGVIR